LEISGTTCGGFQQIVRGGIAAVIEWEPCHMNAGVAELGSRRDAAGAFDRLGRSPLPGDRVAEKEARQSSRLLKHGAAAQSASSTKR
jgi:hypothetical protein